MLKFTANDVEELSFSTMGWKTDCPHSINVTGVFFFTSVTKLTDKTARFETKACDIKISLLSIHVDRN